MTRSDEVLPRWLPYRRPVPDPAVRLFCLPHAGASASAFRQWSGWLPPWVEVCAVQPPARETRWRDEPPPTLAALVDDLAEALGPLLRTDYALCGTSFGALVAFLLAHRLRELGNADPVRLFVAAMPAPERLRVPAVDPTDEPVLAGLLARSHLPAVPPGTELAALIHRVHGHDLRLAATYRAVAGPPLDCPITVFGGRADPDVPVDDLAGWRSHTTATCNTHLLPGGHFFFRESAPLLVAQIATDLRRMGDDASSSTS